MQNWKILERKNLYARLSFRGSPVRRAFPHLFKTRWSGSGQVTARLLVEMRTNKTFSSLDCLHVKLQSKKILQAYSANVNWWRRRELNPRPWQTNQPRLH